MLRRNAHREKRPIGGFMKLKQEFAHPDFRIKLGGEIRAAGQFNAGEVRAIMEARPALGLGQLQDLRALECPESIFLHIVEQRAKKMGIKHTATDSERRQRAAELSAQIARDAETERANSEQVRGWFDSF